MSGPDPVTLEVRALERLDLEALRAEWRRRYGTAPKLRSPDLLRRLLAWRIQAAAFGDLDPDLRRKLKRAAPTGRMSTLRPGVQIAREWRGVRHDVEVIEGGFSYAGRSYRSLSQVAFAITGTKWNGPRFFGLRTEEGV